MGIGRIIGFIVFIIVLLLPDAYIYFSKVHESFPSERSKQIGKIVYFTSLLFQFGGMLFLFFYISLGGGERTVLTNLLQAIVWMVFIVKLVMIPFLLVGDGYRLIEFFIKLFQGAEEMPARVENRRTFIKQASVIAAGLPFIAFLHGMTRGKYNFKIKKVSLAFENLPQAFDGFRVAQFSDFHAGSFDSMSSVEYGLNLLQEQGADLILFTGDLVNQYAEEMDPYIDLFQNVKAPYGQYASLGNHDYGYRNKESRTDENRKAIRDKYAACNMELLNNAHVKLEKDGEHICVAGVENWGVARYFPKRGDLNAALEGIEDGDFTILMSHDPTHWDAEVKKHPKHVDLTLSGHTHGAQMGVELLGLKWSPGKYVYKRWAGLYENAKQYLYVNRGFGMLEGFSFRAGIFPEITVFELKKA